MTPEEHDATNIFLTGADFLQDAEENPVAEEFFNELESGDSLRLLDQIQMRRQEDWSFLAHQVVGGESTTGANPHAR